MTRALLLTTLFAGAAFGQLGAPLIGYVPDASGLRPLYGSPAAGAIGSAIAAGRDFARIAVSPGQNFAIVTTADTGEVMVYKPGAALAPISGAQTNPDILAVSPSGTSAALWFPSLGQLQAVSGLPDSLSIRTIDASFLNASPLAVAISDDGQWAAGLWSAGVYVFGPDNQVIPLQTDSGVVALSFFHNTHDLALATAARAERISDVGGSMQSSILYDYSSQPLSPRAIALAFDNLHAVIADSTGKLAAISVSNRSANLFDCHCSPEGLYGLGGSLFRLTGTNRAGRSGAATDLKIFDMNAGAIWIVPPALSQSGGGQ